jgi:carbamoyltransferase
VAIAAGLAADSAFRRRPGEPVATAASLLAEGRIVAIYTKGMEYGPRALGARSILADPRDAGVNARLNARLERSEFMPFAPVVRESDAELVFRLPANAGYAARFMTITCGVCEDWRQRIAAVVHVDGTARPQVIRREPNPLYYDILTAFGTRTGVPVLVNTSFNVHEEPIVNTPEECARALAQGRIDGVVSARTVYVRR